MNREEEIQEVAKQQFDRDDVCYCALVYGFQKGAEWADKHPRWKPTDEQMEDLEYAINMVDKCCEDSLQSLYNELKKL